MNGRLAVGVSREGLLRARRVDRYAARYLVDANVLSEPTRPAPDPKVVDRLRRHERDIVVDPIIVGEVLFGILKLRKGRRRARLEQWFDAGVDRLNCLPLDAQTGRRWAQLVADLRTAGGAMPIKDSLIAATALTHDLPVVTRNRAGIANAGVTIINPFAD